MSDEAAQQRIRETSSYPARSWRETRLCACGECRFHARNHCPEIADESEPPEGTVTLWGQA